MADISAIIKLADYYDSAFDDDGGIFGRTDWYNEGHKLALMAGKMTYEARNESNPRTIARLRRAAALALKAADVLRGI
jgi:hypothetical protein